MKDIQNHNEALLYLKQLKKAVGASPISSVETEYVHSLLGTREEGWAGIQLILKNGELIKDDEQSRGNISITQDGLRYLRLNTKPVRFARELQGRLTKYGQPLWETNRFTIVTFCFLLLLYLVVEKIIVGLLNQYWIDPIAEPFQPGVGFTIVYIFLSVYLIYINRRQPFKAWDLFLLCIYTRYRFFYPIWYFKPVFSLGRFEFAYTDIIFVYYGVVLYFTLRPKLKKTKNDFPDGYLYPDLPLNEQVKKRGVSISVLDKDGLERNKYAEQISTVISLMKPFKAFSIGLSGPWGSGKSSLLALVEANIKELKNANKFTVVWFSPWLFKDSEMLIANFFSLLEKNFRYNKGLANQLKTYGKEIALLEKSILKTEFSSVLFEENIGLKQRYDIIKEQIEEEGQILVINIDDLDRLAKKEIVQVFRLIRIIADFPNTFYIVAYDRSYVTAAIRQVLTKHEPERYLDKVFNVEFKIPEVSSTIILERLRKAIDQRKTTLAEKIGTIRQEEYEDCFRYKDITRFIRNERDIIRFTNNLMMRYIVIKGEVNFYQFFLLELINYHAPGTISELFENRDKILSLAYSSPEINWNILLKDHKPDEEITGVLEELFRRSSGPYGINTHLYFTRYFSLSLLRTEFSNSEFQSALDAPLEDLKAKLVQFNSSNSSLLREKLDAIDSFTTSNENDHIDKITRALLFFYRELFVVRKLGSGPNDVSTTTVQKLVFSMARKKAGIDNQIQFLSDHVTHFDKSFFAAFSELFSPEAVYDYISVTEDQAKLRTAFRNINYYFLEQLINKHGQTFDPDILRQLQDIHRYVGVTRVINSEDEFWFIESVLKRNQNFFLLYMPLILGYIDENFIKAGKGNEIPEFIRQRFHKPEELYFSPTENDYLDTFIEYYYGYQPKLAFTELNEAIFPALAGQNDSLFFNQLLPLKNARLRIDINYHGIKEWAVQMIPGWTDNIEDFKRDFKEYVIRIKPSSADKEIRLSVGKESVVNTITTEIPRITVVITYQTDNLLRIEIKERANILFTREVSYSHTHKSMAIQCDKNALRALKRIGVFEKIANMPSS